MGVPYSFKNNNLGTVAKYEASPELLEALKTTYKPKVDPEFGRIQSNDAEYAKYVIENTDNPNIY